MLKKWNIIVVALAVLLLLSGCSINAVSDLYCLPKRSEEHTNLQSLIKTAMDKCEYSAPVTGDNRQTVQSADLDGDGEDEYLLFAKDSSEKPLKIFVFSGDGTNYQLLDTIESTGSSFDRIEYIQMDGRRGYEIVVGHQVSDQVVGSVSVYTLQDRQLQQVMTANYSEFICCDLDLDGRSGVFVLHPDESGNGLAELYSFHGQTLERSQEVSMSEPAENIKRIMYGRLNDGVRAIYVASAVTGSDGIITDVYCLIDGALTNVSLSNESGTSVQTLRNYYIYADDIDGDGVLELPSLINMHSEERLETVADQYVIRWYAMNSDGSEVDKLYSYHNLASNWYLQLDEEIAQRYMVEQKGSSFEFSLWDESFTEARKVFTIYILTGQKREEQATTDNRFVLHRTESTIFAASLEVASAEYGLTQDKLIKNFHLILKDWKNGEI